MRIGSLVQCVDDRINHIQDFNEVPIKGEYYVVRKLQTHLGTEGVILEELHNKIHKSSGLEFGFLIWRFIEIQPPMDLTELLEETKYLSDHSIQMFDETFSWKDGIS